jgi:hypothetical protein
VTDQPPPARAPPPDPPRDYGGGNGRLGMIERLAAIANRMTYQNTIAIGALVIIAVPAFGVWRFLTDDTLRDDLLNSIRLRPDLAAACSVFESTINGVKRIHVSAFVDAHSESGDEFYVSGRMQSESSPAQVADICRRLHMLAGHLRAVPPEHHYNEGGSP